MAAGSTYTPIATYSATGSPTSYTFSSIPATYTDLILVSNIVRSSTAQTDIQLNGDTSTNYSYTLLQGNGSSASSSRGSSVASAPIGYGTSSPSTEITHFQNYSNTTTYKTYLSSSSEAAVWRGQYVGLWRSTAAINSIKILMVSGNFATGSTFTLYGLAKA